MIGSVPMRKFESQVHDRGMIAAMLEMIPIVHVGLHDGDWPYVVPMSFGYEVTEEALRVYLHCAREGHKVELWRKDPRVSLTFSIFQNRPNQPYRGSIHDYRSVMANGVIRQLERGKSGGLHGRGVQAILRHNGRRPNQFSVPHYQFMDVYLVECRWENVTAKSEEPMESLADVPFPTPEELRGSTKPPYDYDAFFTRKVYLPAQKPPAAPAPALPGVECPSPQIIWIGCPTRPLRLGFWWDIPAGEPLDCDLLALVLDREGKLRRRYDLAFYNQRRERSGGVRHLGDDILTGPGGETVAVELEALPDFCGEVVFLLAVYQAAERRQHLGMLRGLLLTLEDRALGERLNCPLETAPWQGKGAAVAARLIRQPEGWQLSGPDGRAWEDWRVTALFPDYGLLEWRE
ncbi:MAG: hypothetical protein HFF13_02735 [Angelakisella sp.]|jgi:stress response protein SCP2/nitroimidazol reductase NimA-like FMN-containing flavoprotein (pyridoxamine 5'-phosphate oxidase superfamily)|nr:hypothetical protein [Angelakisella sp.]